MFDPLFQTLLHLDHNLVTVVHEYGIWTYVILFFILFMETGFVITPFLPGDSLLFVAGAAAAGGVLDLWWLVAACLLGAVVGDTVNYWIGNYLGLKVFLCRFPGLVKKEYIDRTYGFYEKYGGATIFIARFFPIIRTFAPFLAGVGSMQYRRFLFYNVLGGICWTCAVVFAGYFLGSFPVVRENMSLLITLVVLLTAGTLLFIAAALIRAYFAKRNGECGKEG